MKKQMKRLLSGVFAFVMICSISGYAVDTVTNAVLVGGTTDTYAIEDIDDNAEVAVASKKLGPGGPGGSGGPGDPDGGEVGGGEHDGGSGFVGGGGGPVKVPHDIVFSSGAITLTYDQTGFGSPVASCDKCHTAFVYSSSDTTVVTVDPATGKLTIVGVGNATITAAAGDKDGCLTASATYAVTVLPAASTGAPVYTTVSDAGYTLADAGLGLGTLSPSGTVTWDLPDSTEITAHTSYAWTFTPDDSNYTVLTGTAVLYTPVPEAHDIVVTPSIDPLNPLTLYYDATGFDSPEAVCDECHTAFTYSSSDTSVVTVDSATGELTIVGVGTATITIAADAKDDCLAASTTYDVEILPAASTGLPSYSTVSDAGYTLADAGLGLGTLSPSGTVTWDLPNDTEITAHTIYNWTFTPDDSNYTILTGSAILYTPVDADEAHDIVLTPSIDPLVLVYGETGFDSPAASCAECHTEFTYSSSDASVVTVNPATGELTIVGVGNATILIAADAKDDCLAASTSYDVTVVPATPAGVPTYKETNQAGDTLAKAGIGLGTLPPTGTVTWDLGDDEEIVSGNTYTWTWVSNDGNYTDLTGSAVLYAEAPPAPPVTNPGTTTRPSIVPKQEPETEPKEEEAPVVEEQTLAEVLENGSEEEPEAEAVDETVPRGEQPTAPDGSVDNDAADVENPTGEPQDADTEYASAENTATRGTHGPAGTVIATERFRLEQLPPGYMVEQIGLDEFMIFDEFGTPLGFVKVPEGMTLEEMNVMMAISPMMQMKMNPATGDRTPADMAGNTVWVSACAGIAALVLIAPKKRRKVNGLAAK